MEKHRLPGAFFMDCRRFAHRLRGTCSEKVGSLRQHELTQVERVHILVCVCARVFNFRSNYMILYEFVMHFAALSVSELYKMISAVSIRFCWRARRARVVLW